MSDDLNPAAPAQRRRPRGRTITVATVTAAGLITGGVVAVTAASSNASAPASGSGSASGSASASKAAPKAALPAPSANDIDGTVTAASSDSVTVKSLFGTSRTYAVNSSTKVHRGKSTVAASSLATGDHVHVRGSKSGSTYTATDIDVRLAHIDGTVASISGDTLTVKDVDGFTRTITLASDTTYTKDGSKASRSDVDTGSVVHAEGTVDSDGTSLDASAVDVRTKEAAPPHGPGGPAGPGMGRGPGGHGGPPAGGPGKGAPSGGSSGAPSKAPSNAPSNAPSSVPSGAPSS